MYWLSSKQKTKVVQFYFKTESIMGTKRKYCSAFGPRNIPASRASHAMKLLTRNFIATGTAS